MKKRILCLLISLALLVGLLPFGVLAAEEPANFFVSDELVELIKYWEGFSAKPYWDYGQWTVGYGTRAPNEHLERYKSEGISKEEAKELLFKELSETGKSINSFINKFGLKATQQQFDAMVSFSYNVGSAWTIVPCVIRTAFIEGWTGDDLVCTLGEWCHAGGVFLTGLCRRRLSEANIYLNGVYDAAPPKEFSYVTFNGNGGKPSTDVQCYVNTEPVDIRSTATYDGCVFEGWYTDPTGGEKVEKLDASMNRYVLYAHWSAGEGEGNPQDTPAETITGKPVDYTKEVVASRLNVFKQPVKGALVVDALVEGELVEIVAEYTDSNGVKWGEVKDVGWINLSYVQDPVDDSLLEGVTVKVTGVAVNIRRGPGTTYACVGVADVGQEIVITRTATGGGYTWGKFSQGWIALKYTNYDDVINESIENDNNNNNNDNTNSDNNNNETTPDVEEETPAPKGVMGTVNADYLYIRSDAGVTNAVVGGLTNNTRVEILEKKAVGGTIWGRIDKGWISLQYVKLDSADETPEEKPVEPEKPEETAVTGKIKLTSGALNVRTGPSTGYTICGYYMNGESVTILEQKTVGTMAWGRTDRGWICLDYVKLDEQAEPEKPAEPEQPTEPEQPEEPAEPETPTEPEKPVEPELPAEPETPVEPETPAEPEKPAEPEQPAGETGTVKLTSGCLRIRSGAGIQNDIVGNLYNGDKVTVTERKTVGGTQWGKISKGWICLDYVKFDTTTDNSGTTPPSGDSNNNSGSTNPPAQKPAETVSGKVKVNDYLCVRSGAGTNYTVVAFYTNGNQVTILEQKEVAGSKWGRTDKGWISLSYVVLDNPEDGETNATPNVITGTVTGIGLRIRSGAGTENQIVGGLTIGDKVTILETTTVNGIKWGRIQSGWICLDYVKLD